MATRDGRPLLLVDIAVPRDIEPACREIAGVSLHDIDDVQQIVERNASGREAEARRAERIIEAELDRFERWLASLEVVPTISALRERADEVVRRVLAENEPRWESLSEADRERLDAMAKAIASRLLHEPTLRMKRSAGSDDAYLYVSALRELFGLDAETEPEADGRRPKRDRAAPQTAGLRAPLTLRIATRGSALALAQAGQVAEMLGGAELVEVSSDGEPGDKARFVRGVERALLDGEAEIGVHSAKDLPAEMPEGLAIAAVPAREDPADAWIGVGSSLDDVPEGARVGTASLRRRAQLLAARPGPAGARSCTATSTPGCAARRGRAGRDRARRRRPAAAGTRGRDLLPDPRRADDPGAGPGRAGPADPGERRDAPARPRREIGEETRAARADRGAGRRRPARARPARRRSASTPESTASGSTVEAFVGLPDGSEWIRDRVEGEAEQPGRSRRAPRRASARRRRPRHPRPRRGWREVRIRSHLGAP